VECCRRSEGSKKKPIGGVQVAGSSSRLTTGQMNTRFDYVQVQDTGIEWYTYMFLFTCRNRVVKFNVHPSFSFNIAMSGYHIV
jgi:hypothetical protein